MLWFRCKLFGSARFCLLPLLALLSACGREQAVLLPPPPDILIVNCLFSPDSFWQVRISQPLSSSDTASQGLAVSGAEVQLWAGDSLVGEMQELLPGCYRLDSRPQPGIRYTLRAQASGFPPVEASDEIPPAAADLGGQLDTSARVSFLGGGFSLENSYYLATVSFEDAAPDSSYYRLLGYFKDSVIRYPSPFSTDLPDTNFLGDGHMSAYFYTDDSDALIFSRSDQRYILMEDLRFNQQRKTLRLFMSHYDFHSDAQGQVSTLDNGEVDRQSSPRKYMEVYVEVRAMSRAYYLFAAGYLQQGFNTGDPFAIHNNVYSNVLGGRGIFAGYQGIIQRIF